MRNSSFFPTIFPRFDDKDELFGENEMPLPEFFNRDEVKNFVRKYFKENIKHDWRLDRIILTDYAHRFAHNYKPYYMANVEVINKKSYECINGHIFLDENGNCTDKSDGFLKTNWKMTPEDKKDNEWISKMTNKYGV